MKGLKKEEYCSDVMILLNLWMAGQVIFLLLRAEFLLVVEWMIALHNEGPLVVFHY